MNWKWSKIAVGVVLALAIIIASWQAGGNAQERKSKTEIEQLKTKVSELERKKDVRGNSGFSRDQCAEARSICGFNSGNRRRSTNNPAALHKQRLQQRDRGGEKAGR